ncbi:hypothetical protein KKF91_21270 [Myxococcota bacterium]|nr:hypothetical protein [Myxococcota bacterium]MBU1433076.1 hypothetical protein [Myxococcota bacterium]MBU1896500.1 hypothetical protein [Myxococcota bacterium]
MKKALIALILMAPAALYAQRYSAASGGYSVELIDEYANPLTTYAHQGSTYVLGTYNQRYKVRVRNHTGARVEAVITVDGRDVITGDPGNHSTQRGYVINPYDSVVIDGFRKNMNQVAAFRFTTPGDSYAGRRGSAWNAGVIGVALFPERPQPQPVVIAEPRRRHDPYINHVDDWAEGESKAGEAAEAAPAAPSAMGGAVADAAPMKMKRGGRGRSASAAPRNNLGTRYGETHHSQAVEVPFERAYHTPGYILAVYYDNAAGLHARGINVYGYPPSPPPPFPHRQFAPPPR